MDNKTLYLSDLDGTLLRPDETISSYTVDVINNFIQNGGYFSFATARSAVTAANVTGNLNVNLPIICYNGGFIINSATKEVLHSNFFMPDDSDFIRRTLMEHKIYPIVYSYIDGAERFSFIEKYASGGMRQFQASRAGDVRERPVEREEDLYAGEIFYFTCVEDEEKIAPVHAMICCDSRFNCIYYKDIYCNGQWCEIMPSGVSKAVAALKLKELMGSDKLISFGDGINDIPMFKVSDECYAMSNAAPELKAVATDVIGGNNEDGVAKWIEENVGGH